MAFKLRRPPLLVYDNGPIYTRCYDHHHNHHHQTSAAALQMECGLSTTTYPNSSANGGSPTTVNMERSPTKGHKELHVNFEPEKVEIHERKKKFLTAKYGTHQMNLIKKRLGVEMWMYDELQFLFDSTDDCEVELDLDELLDIDGDSGRKNWLMDKLINAKQSQEAVKKFIDELMSRAKTL